MKSSSPLIFGTRASALAQAQTELVMQLFQEANPEVAIAKKEIITRGDAHPELRIDQPHPSPSNIGLFTKQLEEALLTEEIDVAVHSLKDLPIATPPGLKIMAILPRATTADLLVTPHRRGIKEALDSGTTATKELGAFSKQEKFLLGSSSPRRKAFFERTPLGSFFHCCPIRGNVATRLRKAAFPTTKEPLDGVILAAAGLERLGYPIPLASSHRPKQQGEKMEQEVISWFFEEVELFLHPLPTLLPAPAQGAIAIEMKIDHPLSSLFFSLHDLPTAEAVKTERLLLASLGGGCQMALGASAYRNPTTQLLELEGSYLPLDSQQLLYGKATGPTPEEVAFSVASQLQSP